MNRTDTISPQPVTFYGHGGLRLAGDEWGRDTGYKIVLLLHGGGQTRHSWKETGERLAARGFRVVALDARGHGESEWADAGGYSLELFAADVVAVVKQLGEPVSIVGASLGGLTGILAAHQLDEAVRKLILVDIVPKMEMQGGVRIREFMRRHLDGFSHLEDAADAISEYLPHRKRPTNLDGLRRNLRLRDDGRWYWHWDPKFIDDPAEHLTELAERLESIAANLGIPILVVRGGLSDVVSRRSVHSFLDAVPSAQFVELDSAAHTAPGDDNDAFTSVVVEFV
ncbi:alpha/beta hydrolase [Hoyosella sp. YIM 151337]|uniref:alpha/beta fold hydrolase n=1 Tax=Hoyosella sp. YIM 151337 TaxID=2992742 RepID=UPI0022359ECF|nr:alpha/beta hydrolase [Hoyosella sp. YIM 151337]MCW4352481.1 alpha/beta hydrolase [Hoyosella sp. YIM 151337]